MDISLHKPRALVDPLTNEPFDLSTKLPSTLPCGHTFLITTINSLRFQGKNNCPTCNAAIPQYHTVVIDLELCAVLAQQANSKFCYFHNDQKAEYLCMNEKKLLCVECYNDQSHQDHQRGKLDIFLKNVKIMASQLETFNQKFESSGDNIKARILGHMASLADLVAGRLKERLRIVKDKNEELLARIFHFEESRQTTLNFDPNELNLCAEEVNHSMKEVELNIKDRKSVV